jgi:DNA end-binding protein Ku
MARREFELAPELLAVLAFGFCQLLFAERAMSIRPSWRSVIRLSLVSVPVQGFTAAVRERGEIHFHQLHAKCHSRIRYKKVCPIHGEVPNDEIVSGYEYGKDHYVTLEPGELDAARPENDKAINLDAFVRLEAIDPIYFTDDLYYLLPDGKGSDKPYAVLHRSMTAEEQCGVGEAVLWGRERLVLLRPLGNVLGLMILKYPQTMRTPETVGEDFELRDVSSAEMKMAKTLLAATTPKKFDLNRYTDDYRESVKALIDAKVKGREIVSPPEADEPPVISLMDALRKSVQRAKQPAKRAKPAAKKVRKTAS